MSSKQSSFRAKKPREEEKRELALATAGVCPTCKGNLLDLRDGGFNPEAMIEQGQCVWWAPDRYQCSQVQRSRPHGGCDHG